MVKPGFYALAVLVLILAFASTCLVASGFKPYSTHEPPPDVYRCIRLAWVVERYGVNDSFGLRLLEQSVYYSGVNYSLATIYASKALSYYESLAPKAPSIYHRRIALYTLTGLSAAAAAYLLYRLVPRLYLTAWYRLFRNRKLRLGGGSRSLLWDPEVRAVLAAVVVVAVVFAIAYPLSKRRVEPFTAIGLLGPEKKIGGYPRSIVSGSTIKLYIYLYNHEGRVMLYRIDFQVLNQTYSNTTKPPPLPVAGRLYVILPSNATITIPFNATVPGVGRLRLTWWLYKYNATLGSYVYSGEWVHPWINSIPPS